MKRFLITLALVAVLVASAWAEGTSTYELTEAKPYWRIVTWTVIANAASAATIPDDTTNIGFSAQLCKIATVPGSPAPTGGYDLTIKDSNGVDLTGGALANRSASEPEQVTPIIGGAYGCNPFKGTLTLGASGNSVNSATFTVETWLYHEQGIGR